MIMIILQEILEFAADRKECILLFSTQFNFFFFSAVFEEKNDWQESTYMRNLDCPFR